MGYQFLLQGIFPTQGWNPCLLLGRRILYHWATREDLSRVQSFKFSLNPRRRCQPNHKIFPLCFAYILCLPPRLLRYINGPQKTKRLVTIPSRPLTCFLLQFLKDPMDCSSTEIWRISALTCHFSATQKCGQMTLLKIKYSPTGLSISTGKQQLYNWGKSSLGVLQPQENLRRYDDISPTVLGVGRCNLINIYLLYTAIYTYLLYTHTHIYVFN